MERDRSGQRRADRRRRLPIVARPFWQSGRARRFFGRSRRRFRARCAPTCGAVRCIRGAVAHVWAARAGRSRVRLGGVACRGRNHTAGRRHERRNQNQTGERDVSEKTHVADSFQPRRTLGSRMDVVNNTRLRVRIPFICASEEAEFPHSIPARANRPWGGGGDETRTVPSQSSPRRVDARQPTNVYSCLLVPPRSVASDEGERS